MEGSPDLRSLPKAELHLHLEGAMRPSTLTDLCAKHGLDRPADTRGQRFENFGGFVATYMAACECLRDEADIMRLVREVAEDAKESGALWIELGLSMCLYHERFGGMRGCLKLLLRAAEAAETSTSVGIGLIVSAERMHELFPMAVSEELAATVASLVADGEALINGHPGIVGFGLHGDESGHPPQPFKNCFEVACGGSYSSSTDMFNFATKGQQSDSSSSSNSSSSGSDGDGSSSGGSGGFRVAALPHAGELHPSAADADGPASVRYCVEQLGAKRIAHGVLAVSDPELVGALADGGVCLDVCPSSNFLLSVVPELSEAAHPLKRLLAAGVTCTVNSDDPLLFGSSLLQEYELCRSQLGLTDTELARCAAASFEYSHAPAELKARGAAEVAEWVAGASQPVLSVDASSM